jgi:ABC-2 type transport system ATP-binding protein
MLTGILHPTSGLVEVLSLTPWKERRALGYKIGTVFGQRTQLWPSLPPSDSFHLLSKIYEIEKPLFETRLKELVDLFEIDPLLQKPVRHLSLGERMRCELVASLLHNPSILFLDEPTIGLDINAKLKIRGLLNKLSKEQGTTLFLTSHDTADIEQVCDRVLILDQGTILLDSPLKELKKNFIKRKILSLTTDVEKLVLDLPGIKVLENGDHHFVCEINVEENPIERVIHETLKQTSLKDVTIEDPSMEEIIRTLYKTRRHG